MAPLKPMPPSTPTSRRSTSSGISVVDLVEAQPGSAAQRRHRHEDADEQPNAISRRASAGVAPVETANHTITAGTATTLTAYQPT